MNRSERLTPSATWDEPGEPYAALAETHANVVVFLGDRAYKVKKPVSFPFVDLSTRSLRERDCARELHLNRRLAPDVYLGIARLVGEPGLAPSETETGEPVVVMRRMPTRRRLSTLAVSRTEDMRGPLRETARLLADLHARLLGLSDGGTDQLADRVHDLWEQGFTQSAGFAGSLVDADALATAHGFATEYVAGRRPLFAARERRGLVKDGHGDLLADDIFCLDDGVRVLDCLEFDIRLRVGDVLADACFLAMDLERLGRADLARHFLDRYAEYSGENHPASLEHHYVAYRAFVRAKVECLRAEQSGESDNGDGPADRARTLLGLTVDHLRAGRVRLVLLGGLPGSGKSTLAAAMADRSPQDWALLRSDVVRKELAGLPPDESAEAPYGSGLYDTAHTRHTYTEMLHRAESLLGQGVSVLVDASWSAEAHRQDARAVGRRTHVPVVEVRADAPAPLRARRLEQRPQRLASDATVDVLDRMAADADPWPEAHRLDTSGDPEGGLAELVALVGR